MLSAWTSMWQNTRPLSSNWQKRWATERECGRDRQADSKKERERVTERKLSPTYEGTHFWSSLLNVHNIFFNQVAELKAKLDKKAHLPSSRHSYDPAEASRLQGLVKAVYSERCRLRKQMAELDTSEREALLKVSRKVCFKFCNWKAGMRLLLTR